MREFIEHRYRGGPAPSVVEESRGAGGYTLCARCNNRCSRYATHFIEWAVFWQTALDSDPAALLITAAPFTRRSRVMKQIAAMVLSASPPKTGEIHPDLRRFVWNTQVTGPPIGIRVFAALTRDKDARQAGGAGKLNTESGEGSVFCEVAYAPLILVTTFGNTSAPDPRLVETTYFATAGYNDRLITDLTLPVLGLQGFYPGAYR